MYLTRKIASWVRKIWGERLVKLSYIYTLHLTSWISPLSNKPPLECAKELLRCYFVLSASTKSSTFAHLVRIKSALLLLLEKSDCKRLIIFSYSIRLWSNDIFKHFIEIWRTVMYNHGQNKFETISSLSQISKMWMLKILSPPFNVGKVSRFTRGVFNMD